MTDVLDHDATGQADLVRRREITAEDLACASIDAIERLDPDLDLILHRAYELALEKARRPIDPSAPFCGVPMLLKDIELHATGIPFSHGSIPVLRRHPIICDHDSNLAADLRRAGFGFLGRANTSLQAFFGTHDADAHVMPRNPWDRNFSTAGSSSGSAAAVAARVVAVAHGGDGGGSIRLPASVNGVVGMKPTRGRVSVGPDRTEVFSFGAAWSHEFVMTRTVRDTAGVLAAVQGWRPGDSSMVQAPVPHTRRPLRVGVTTAHFSQLGCPTHPAHVAAAEQAGKVVEALGHEVEVAQAPQYGWDHVEWMYGQPGSPHYAMVGRLLDKLESHLGRPVTPEDVGPQLWAGAELGRSYTAGQMLEFAEVLQQHVVHWDRWWLGAGIDVLLSPTVPIPTPPMSVYLPPPHGSFVIPPDNPMGGYSSVVDQVGYTQVFNWTGQPAISLPLYEGPDGLPLGIQIAAGRQQDELLLDLAFQLEEALPWAHRRPVHCA